MIKRYTLSVIDGDIEYEESYHDFWNALGPLPWRKEITITRNKWILLF